MSNADKLGPVQWAPVMRRMIRAPQLTPVPGLRPEAIRGLDASYPGTLTDEMRTLLHKTCGLSISGFATIDFTGGWYPEEPISVLRPSLTLAIDDEGRRWIGETSRQQGLPGPIWCVLPEPAVAIYVSDDLNGFMDKLNAATPPGDLARWLRGLHADAHGVWANRHAVARQSYERCRRDRALRRWLAELPGDASIYDLRAPCAVRGWPYGLAGPEGRFYRCGRLPVFAVAAAPWATHWQQCMGPITATGEAVAP